MPPRTAAVALAALGLALVATVRGQGTDAVCDPSFDWAKNSQGLSPCAVSASLLALCSNTQTWIVPKLTPGNTYRAPNASEANPCQCSTVTFSVLAACSLCQGEQPVPFTKWSADCKDTDITINNFPFANTTTDIPLWSRWNTTSDGSFDLQAAKRIVGVDDGSSSSSWPVRDIVLVSFGIASAFFIVFLGVFCYLRRRRIFAYLQKRRHRSKGKYVPVDPSQKHGRVKSAHPGTYPLDLDAPRSHSASYASSVYDDPFGYTEGRAVSPLPALQHPSGSGPYSETSKPYAGPSTASLSTTNSASRVQPTDNMMKHPASTSTVNVLHRESGGSASTSSRPLPAEPPRASPPASQGTFGSHPAHHQHERPASSSSLARPGHRSTPSGSSLRGYEQGPTAPLFSRTKQVANRRKDTDFSIDGSSSRRTSDSSYYVVSPAPTSPPAIANHFVTPVSPFARQPLSTIPSNDGATMSPSSGASSGATLVHPGPTSRMPLVQVTAPSAASDTLVSHHGRIEHASHHAQLGHVDDDEEARTHWEEIPRPTGERDPFATLRELAITPDPDGRDVFGDDYARR